MAEKQTDKTAESATPDKPAFMMERIYTKDISFETPNSPQVFRSEWKPEVKLDLQTQTHRIEGETHEVVLRITVTVKSKDKTAFLVELHQAGIFTFRHFTPEHLHHALGCKCPEILFPYARARIADLIVHGGFPQLNLAPVNFEALYLQHLKSAAESKETQKKAP